MLSTVARSNYKYYYVLYIYIFIYTIPIIALLNFLCKYIDVLKTDFLFKNLPNRNLAGWNIETNVSRKEK